MNQLQSESYYPLVTDQGMPEMTGSGLCRKLKADSGTAGPPVMLSQPVTMADLAKMMAKLFSSRELLAAVESCLPESIIDSRVQQTALERIPSNRSPRQLCVLLALFSPPE